ncbi:MAG: hypothetical protein M3Y26_09550 [Actinomycetota bacterium]|nr:hypothetical protein [Actinomycetota bacterium]
MTLDDIVMTHLGQHLAAPENGPTNSVSLLWMLQDPDVSVAQVVAAFRSLAAAGRVRSMTDDGQVVAVVVGLTA